jgi:Na+-driven multidrug efflux pump
MADPAVARARVLGEGPIFQTLINIAWASVVSMTVNSLYLIADSSFVSRLVGVDGLTSLTLFSSLEFALDQAPAMMGGIGGSSLVGQYFGANKPILASKSLAHSYFLFLISSVLVPVIFLPFIRPLLLFCGASDATAASTAILEDAVLYGRVLLVCSFGYNLCQGSAPLVRAGGRAQLAMVLSVVSSLLNCLLDPILIRHYGLVGAAYSTVFSQLIPGAWILWYITFSKTNPVPVRWRQSFADGVDWPLVLRIVQIGSGAAFSKILGGAWTVVAFVALRMFSTDDANASRLIAIWAVVSKPGTLMLMPSIGLGQASVVLVAFNFGARQFRRAFKSLKYTVSISLVFGVAALALFLLLSPQIVQLFGFTTADADFEYCVSVLRLFMISVPPVMLLFAVQQTYSAVGWGGPSAILSASRQLFQFPAMLLLPMLARHLGSDDPAKFVFGAVVLADYVNFIPTVYATFVLFRYLLKLDKGEAAMKLAGADDLLPTRPTSFDSVRSPSVSDGADLPAVADATDIKISVIYNAEAAPASDAST